jgi:hypothetical protein
LYFTVCLDEKADWIGPVDVNSYKA